MSRAGRRRRHACDGAAIEVDEIVKDYGGRRGVFGISFAVERHEVFGLLGPNGAGKTVTMRHLMGFLRPDSGRTSIFGRDCFAERPLIQMSLGYLPGEVGLMEEMTAAGFLGLMAKMRHLDDRRRMRELIDLFELDASRGIRRMSKGTKQKVALVCAFMGSPDLLLLDEPTSGLDPLMQQRFVDLLLDEKRRGVTVLLSSHIFEEVERTCDRVAFVRAGRVAAVRRMDEVRSDRGCLIRVRFADASVARTYVENHRGVRSMDDTDVEVRISGAMDGFVKDLASYPVADFSTREQALEEIFMSLYEDAPAAETVSARRTEDE